MNENFLCFSVVYIRDLCIEMCTNRFTAISKHKRVTRVFCFCFITLGFYMVYTYETSKINGQLDIGSEKEYALEKRRNYRKELLLKAQSDEKLHRTPDAILIGAAKCGTSTLRDFMQHHPLVQFLSVEAHYFDRDIDKGIEYYKHLLPPASRHEILMEKTPFYFESPQPDLPDVMNRECPGVKLILLLCNPIDRLFSRYVMGYIKRLPKKYNSNKLDPNFVNYSFEKNFTDELLSYFHEKMNVTNDELFCPKEYYREFYICTIRGWIKSFGLERILILDGEELLQDPGSVINKVQDYLQIPRVLRKRDFVRSPVSGMFCLRPWWQENYNFKAEKSKRGLWYENLICMWNGKGVTRSETSKYVVKNRTRRKLQKMYKPYNERLFKLLNRIFNW